MNGYRLRRPHSHFPLKTYMLRTGLGLKKGLHCERMEPWHSIVIVMLVNTLQVWHREMNTSVAQGNDHQCGTGK
jgi:hypothetical protein